MSRLLLRCFVLFFCIGCSEAGYCANIPYSQQPVIKQFIQQMVTQHHFEEVQLNQLFNQVIPNPRIIETMTAPHEALPWYRYRALFVTPERIHKGSEFWREHGTLLNEAQKQYGISPRIIIAILGVETDYGHVQGNYKVIDALSTLAFHYPPRSSYFRSELEQFLLLTREMHLDPLQVYGSYAGAIGQPQFMPSSYRKYGVDTSGKGYSNLMNNRRDVIMSVANYFKAYGWQPGGLVAIRAQIKKQHSQAMLQNPKAKYSIAQFKQHGIIPLQAVAPNIRASLISMVGAKGTEYWLVFHNFDVIMRYNTSPRYAMAVEELGQAIASHFR